MSGGSCGPIEIDASIGYRSWDCNPKKKGLGRVSDVQLSKNSAVYCLPWTAECKLLILFVAQSWGRRLFCWCNSVFSFPKCWLRRVGPWSSRGGFNHFLLITSETMIHHPAGSQLLGWEKNRTIFFKIRIMQTFSDGLELPLENHHLYMHHSERIDGELATPQKRWRFVFGGMIFTKTNGSGWLAIDPFQVV